MRRFLLAVVLVPLVLGMSVRMPARADDVVPSVRLSRTWKEAVREAKILGAPLVLHFHLYSCVRCRAMQGMLFRHEDYIAHSRERAVDVLVLSGLELGIGRGDARARTLEGRRRGEPAACLATFDGLTVAEVRALLSDDVARFNDSGRRPFSVLLDPHTLEELERFVGMTTRPEILAAVDRAFESLQTRYGPGYPARRFEAAREAVAAAWKDVDQHEYASAVKRLGKATAESEGAPAGVAEILTEAREAILEHGQRALDDIETIAGADLSEARRRLKKLRPKVRGTDLEAPAERLWARITGRAADDPVGTGTEESRRTGR